MCSAVAIVVGGAFACAGVAKPPEHANDNLTEIRVLSNRADLVSGGDALVELVLPARAKADPADVRVDVDGRDVTSAFAVRADGRFYGLVTGLADGQSVLRAQVPNGPGARLVITNYPVGGPIFSGAHVEPWICSTSTVNPSLGPAVDAQCNAPTQYRYMYRTTSNQFAVYDPSAPPPANLATTTTDQGITVPYIVRIERGTTNRGIHDIAVLFDPSKPWTAWATQTGWNRKLFWPFGSGCEMGHIQGGPGNVLNHMALSRGFMVASSSMTQYSLHCNDVTSAETVMMLKEHIIEAYGEIRYTMSSGGSGGTHQQLLHSSNYPGLLQGIMTSQHFQDTWTAGREFLDCWLLARYYGQRAAAGQPWTEAEKASTNGHANASTCEGPIQTYMSGRTPNYMDPRIGGNCGGFPWTYDAVTNPDGERCTLQDFQVAIFGTRPQDGFAKTPIDNTGLQYGLVALGKGLITPEQFVDLNETIGCIDIDFSPKAERCSADPGAAQIAHRSGRVTHGRHMADVAMIDQRDNNVREEHYDFRAYVTRSRLLRDNGTAANQAIWRYQGSAPAGLTDLIFLTVDRWLANVEADGVELPLKDKIIRNRPQEAVDSCFFGSLANVDRNPATCNMATFPVFTDTRVAAGEGATSDIMKCQRKPLDSADYSVAFTSAQWSRLQAAFPTGVCDFSKSGVGQVEPLPWQTFAGGPGGVPLPAAPVSKPGDGGN